MNRLAVAVVTAAVLGACGSPPAAPVPDYDHELASELLVALVNGSTPADDLFSGQFCGGIATGPTTVVTAEHCVTNRAPRTIDVVHGAHDLCTPPPASATRVGVTSIESPSGPGGTLAILHLEEDLPVVRLPRFADNAIGTEAVAAGWGRMSVRGVPRCEAREVRFRVVSARQCSDLPTAVDLEPADVVCTVPAANENTCDGDSGGPVVVYSDRRPVALAVTMTGAGCGADAVGLNVRAATD